jgi:hypothetical protein
MTKYMITECLGVGHIRGKGKYTQGFLWENFKGSHHLEELDVNRRIV